MNNSLVLLACLVTISSGRPPMTQHNHLHERLTTILARLNVLGYLTAPNVLKAVRELETEMSKLVQDIVSAAGQLSEINKGDDTALNLVPQIGQLEQEMGIFRAKWREASRMKGELELLLQRLCGYPSVWAMRRAIEEDARETSPSGDIGPNREQKRQHWGRGICGLQPGK